MIRRLISGARKALRRDSNTGQASSPDGRSVSSTTSDASADADSSAESSAGSLAAVGAESSPEAPSSSPAASSASADAFVELAWVFGALRSAFPLTDAAVASALADPFGRL